MNYRYDPEKATQAAAYLIRKYPDGLEYIKLIKELYIANRNCLKAGRPPVAPDIFVSMPHGPVLSTVFREIKEQSTTTSFWKSHIAPPKNYKVRILADPGTSRLQKHELSELDAVDQIWHKKSWTSIRDWTHKAANVPEWRDPKGSSSTIEVETMLRAVGKLEEEIDEFVAEELAYQEALTKIQARKHEADTVLPDLASQALACHSEMNPAELKSQLSSIAEAVAGQP